METPHLSPADNLVKSIDNLSINDASSASTSTSTSSASFRQSTGYYGGYPSYSALLNSVISESALTPLGSQTIQHYLFLHGNNFGLIQNVFRAVNYAIFDIMTNQYGHHVFGNLIPLLNDLQLYQIATTLAMHPVKLVTVCTDRFGSPSIKRFIKQISRFEEAASVLVIALCKVFERLMVHKTGCHVVLQCVESFSDQLANLLYTAAAINTISLGTDGNGVLALNSLIAASRGPGRIELLSSISDHTVCLAQDPYGNFVVQSLLGLDHPGLTNKICWLLKGCYVKMSFSKGSSHVVEKCLKSFRKVYAVDEFIQCTSKELFQVAKDQYGNFVVQTAINETRQHPELKARHEILVAKIRLLAPHLKLGRHGRIVADLVDRIYLEDKHKGCV